MLRNSLWGNITSQKAPSEKWPLYIFGQNFVWLLYKNLISHEISLSWRRWHGRPFGGKIDLSARGCLKRVLFKVVNINLAKPTLLLISIMHGIKKDTIQNGILFLHEYFRFQRCGFIFCRLNWFLLPESKSWIVNRFICL